MIVLRFLYINIFAILLISLSIIIFSIPQEIFLIILKYFFVLLFMVSGIGIFFQWKLKNRKLKILIARNKKEIRLDTFEQFKETPCGWLVADVGLRELRKIEHYKSLSRKTWKKIRTAALGIKVDK
jgi:hypothetical protein